MNTPQPTPPAPSLNERRPVDAAAARAHQVDAVLTRAEAKLMWIWKNIPASTGLAYRPFYFTDAEVADLRILVDEIRAARGGE